MLVTRKNKLHLALKVNLKTIKIKIWAKIVPRLVLKCKNSSDLLETLHPGHMEGVEYRFVHGCLTIFFSKPKFRKIGPKIQISLDLLENLYTSQFQSAKYESDIVILIVYIYKINLGKLVPKLMPP